MRALPFLAMGLLSGSAIASVVVLFLAPEMRAKRETPARIASCHAQEGTVRLDRRGVYGGCLIPPKAR